MEENLFHVRLKNIMKEKKVKQTELANAIKVSRQTIILYICGKSFPNVVALENICRFLDVSSDYLIGISDSKEINKNNYYKEKIGEVKKGLEELLSCIH